jgi:hypothetical protein
MSRRLRLLLIGASLVAFFLLHDDFWLAADPRLVLGLPAGLLYHVLYCVAAAGLMAVLVRVAWPLAPGAGAASPPPEGPHPTPPDARGGTA